MEGNFYLLSLLPSCNLFGKTFGMERPISVSELHAEKRVAVANAYGSIIALMSRIDLVSKNLLANYFRNCRKRYNC